GRWWEEARRWGGARSRAASLASVARGESPPPVALRRFVAGDWVVVPCPVEPARGRVLFCEQHRLCAPPATVSPSTCVCGAICGNGSSRGEGETVTKENYDVDTDMGDDPELSEDVAVERRVEADYETAV